MLASILMGAGKTANLFGATGEGEEKKDEKPTGAHKKVMNAILATPKALGKMAGKGMGIAGVSLSVSSLLRQSQLFTGTIGALFPVLGGFVDVILAPFMPYLAKFIGKMGTWIPKVQEWAQKVHDWLAENVFPIIAEWAGYIWNGIKKVWEYISIAWDWLSALPWGDWIKGAWNTIKEIGGKVWEQVKQIWDIIGPKIADVISTLWGFIKDTIWPIVKALWDLLMVVADKILFPLIKLGFKIYGFLWDYVGKPIFKVLGWLLQDVPGMIKGFSDFIVSFLSFQWLKSAIASILNFFNKIIGGLANFGMFGKKPFGFLADLEGKLNDTISSLEKPKGGNGNKQELNISVSTNIDGLGSQPEQLKYDLMNQESITQENKVEVNLESNALEPFMPI